MLTGPDRTAEPSAASSSLPSFPSLFSSALISQDAEKKHKLSHLHPHAQLKGQTHMGETDSSQVKSTLGLGLRCGNGRLSFCHPLPPHSSSLHPHINTGKRKPKEGKRGAQYYRTCSFIKMSVSESRPAGGAVLSVRGRK